MTPSARTADTRDRGRRPWRVRLGVPLGAIALRLLGLTWRVQFRGDGAWRDRHRAGDGTVLILWHGQLLPLAYALRGCGIVVLVSEHRDGEIIASLLHQMGNRSVRGSSTRGGARALIAMSHELQKGATVAVTPDGPRGPSRSFAPGALVAAQRARVPVVALHASVSRAWHLKTWDAFTVPKPFAKIVIDFSEPEYVEGQEPQDAAAQTTRFGALIRSRGEPSGD